MEAGEGFSFTEDKRNKRKEKKYLSCICFVDGRQSQITWYETPVDKRRLVER